MLKRGLRRGSRREKNMPLWGGVILLPSVFIVVLLYYSGVTTMNRVLGEVGEIDRRTDVKALLACGLGGVATACSENEPKGTQLPERVSSTSSVRKALGASTTSEAAPTTTMESKTGARHLDLANFRSWAEVEVIDHPSNNELGRYVDRPETVRYEAGKLILEAHGNSQTGFTTGRLFSRSKFPMLYGRLDVTAKLPAARGGWPAIWLFDRDVASGTAPEIDIMEFVGAAPGEINSSAHSANHYPDHGERSGLVIVSTATSAFHTYSIDWRPDHLETFVDGQSILRVNANPDPNEWPYNKPMGLVLNYAIGGDWGGMNGIDDAAVNGSRMEISDIAYQAY